MQLRISPKTRALRVSMTLTELQHLDATVERREKLDQLAGKPLYHTTLIEAVLEHLT